MKKFADNFFLDVFLFLLLVLCLRKLEELKELPTGLEFFLLVVISLVVGPLLRLCYNWLRPKIISH